MEAVQSKQRSVKSWCLLDDDDDNDDDNVSFHYTNKAISQ